jgi:hypothetical protein
MWWLSIERLNCGEIMSWSSNLRVGRRGRDFLSILCRLVWARSVVSDEGVYGTEVYWGYCCYFVLQSEGF